LLENHTYGICRFDVDGRFLEVNEALVTMLGYGSDEELKAVNLASEIIRDPIERAQLFDTYRRTGHIDLIEVEWKRKDGTAMKVRLSGKRVGSEEGAPEGCEIIVEDVTAQRAEEDFLRHLAATDALTGLANYRKLSGVLESEINRSNRTGRPFALLMFDLDGMKQINDRHGHLAGNRALCRLADIFRFACRSIDTSARYGGDEFAIVLPETLAKDATLVGKRICERLSNDGEEPLLSLSMGVAHPLNEICRCLDHIRRDGKLRLLEFLEAMLHAGQVIVNNQGANHSPTVGWQVWLIKASTIFLCFLAGATQHLNIPSWFSRRSQRFFLPPKRAGGDPPQRTLGRITAKRMFNLEHSVVMYRCG